MFNCVWVLMKVVLDMYIVMLSFEEMLDVDGMMIELLCMFVVECVVCGLWFVFVWFKMYVLYVLCCVVDGMLYDDVMLELSVDESL